MILLSLSKALSKVLLLLSGTEKITWRKHINNLMTVPNDPNVLINTIMKALEEIRLRVICLVTISIIFLLKVPNFLDSIFYQKFINAYMTYRVNQLFLTAAFTLSIYLHFKTTICNHLPRGLNRILRTLTFF